MDRGTRIFWLLIGVLAGAALYFGSHAEAQRRAVQKSTGTLHTGEIVELHQVVDGDSIVVTNAAGEKVSVRILGIKTFEPKPEKDPAARFGKIAIEAIEKMAKGEPIRVMLHSTPQDRHGRTVASLFIGDQDLGLALIKQGYALVYTTHPFASMPLYLNEQEDARTRSLGLWADSEVSKRAERLMREWRREVD